MTIQHRTSPRILIGLFLLLMCLPGLIVPQARAGQAIYSVTATEFLRHLKSLNVQPELATVYKDGTIRPDKHAEAKFCTFNAAGALEARSIAGWKNAPPIWCELTLHSSKLRLKSAWLVQRVHWSGAVKYSRFVTELAGGDSLQIHTRLKFAANDKAKKIRVRRLKLRLITLRGPAGLNWKDALSE